jgi:hypothetical protein
MCVQGTYLHMVFSTIRSKIKKRFEFFVSFNLCISSFTLSGKTKLCSFSLFISYHAFIFLHEKVLCK